MDFELFLVSIMFGLGLAMDAFSVSLANGMNEKRMKFGRMCTIAGIFALFQGVMPLIGYLLGSAFIEYIDKFDGFVFRTYDYFDFSFVISSKSGFPHHVQFF